MEDRPLRPCVQVYLVNIDTPLSRVDLDLLGAISHEVILLLEVLLLTAHGLKWLWKLLEPIGLA